MAKKKVRRSAIPSRSNRDPGSSDYSEYTDSPEEEALLDELHDDAPAATDISEQDIEAKYDSNQARIFVQRNDFLVPNILDMVRNKDILDLSPTYQRRSRWNDVKRSHLIESLLMNVPIPPIFLYERDLAKYEVMDGQQRLTSIRMFMSNEFSLKQLKKWPELNGRYFRDLPPRIQGGLERRGLAAVIILTESSQDPRQAMELRQYVFERLNTGGQQLNAQEIRNCIYASHFNNMLIELARSELFTQVWDIPPRESSEPQKVSRMLEKNRLYATMADCEIVLRYFALKDMDEFKSSMKKTLDDCMDREKVNTKRACAELKKDYLFNLELAVDIYGTSLFRLPDRSGDLTGRRSVPLADAVMLAVRTHAKKPQILRRKGPVLLERTRALLNDPETYEVLVGRGNTKAAVEERIRLMKAKFAAVLRS